MSCSVAWSELASSSVRADGKSLCVQVQIKSVPRCGPDDPLPLTTRSSRHSHTLKLDQVHFGTSQRPSQYAFVSSNSIAMPIFGGLYSGRGRSKRDGQSSPAPTGWNAIQDHLLDYDENMMSDFAEDIDTLLVFAGLFSAVLTGFVIAALPSLQPDNSQLSVGLLSVVALRLGADTDQPFINASAAALPRSTTFEASAASVAINSLWVVSLVLSLAAALFGILAKQWCREYLKWYSAPEPAIDNVMLRQIRFEAWQRSGATSIIASVPALLEIAVVLFLAGLVVFVWTLQRIVAVFATLAIGAVLVVVSGLTLMPVISRISPYKSPTGWTLLRFIQPLRDFCHNLLFRPLGDLFVPSTTAIDWRGQDIEYADRPSASAVRGIRQFLSVPDTQRTRFSLTDAFQATLLVRALLWVQQGSTDTALYPAILEGARTLGTRRALRHAAVFRTPGYHYASFAALPPIWRSSSDFEASLVVKISAAKHVPTSLISQVEELDPREYYSMPSLYTGDFGQLEAPSESLAALVTWVEGSTQIDVLLEVILQDLSLLADDWSSARVTERLPGPGVYAAMVASYVRKAVAMLTLVQIILLMSTTHDTAPSRDPRDLSHDAPLYILRRLWGMHDAWRLGVTSAILSVLARTSEVTVQPLLEADQVIQDPPIISEHQFATVAPLLTLLRRRRTPVGSLNTTRCTAARLAQFATQIFGITSDYTLPRERHLFVAAASDALDYAANMEKFLTEDSWDAFDAMFSCMCRATVFSLRNGYVDCGAQIPLPWFASLQSLVGRRRPINNHTLYHRPSPRSKLHRLLTFLQHGVTEHLWGHDGPINGQEAILSLMEDLGFDSLGDPHVWLDEADQEESPGDSLVTHSRPARGEPLLAPPMASETTTSDPPPSTFDAFTSRVASLLPTPRFRSGPSSPAQRNSGCPLPSSPVGMVFNEGEKTSDGRRAPPNSRGVAPDG